MYFTFGGKRGGKNNPNGFSRLTLWSMYLLSSMAERLEWSQEDDEAEGRRRNKQLVSCCCRSMNCFMKLSLERHNNHTMAQRHGGAAFHELIHRLKESATGNLLHPECDNVFAARFSPLAPCRKDTLITASVVGKTDLRRRSSSSSRLTDGLQGGYLRQ